MLKFSVIIPTMDRPDRLAACLTSFTQANYPVGDWELIVVNDGGAFLFSHLPRGTYTLRVISLDPQYGFADIEGVYICSDSITVIDSIILPVRELGIPVVEARYDTLEMKVILSWTRVPGNAGYNIYRSHRGVQIQTCFHDKVNQANRLSHMDILITHEAGNGAEKPVVLIEIEETDESPKTAISDVFSLLFAEYAHLGDRTKSFHFDKNESNE